MPRIPKPQRVNLTRQCLQSIQQYIVENSLGAGDKLPSLQEWAEILGVSVIVVREAFRSLEALGAIDMQHGRGIFVRGVEETDFLDLLSFRHSLDSFTMEEIVEARAMLELTVLESCIARADEQAIAKLECNLEELYQSQLKIGLYTASHARFHRTMLETSGNRFLVSIGMPLLNTFWSLGRSEEFQAAGERNNTDLVDVHADYMEAIKNRDFSHTRELVDRHLFGLCATHRVFPCGVGADEREPCFPVVDEATEGATI